MNDINKMPPKCQYCPYWEVCKYPWVCPDIGDNKPDLQPTCNEVATDDINSRETDRVYEHCEDCIHEADSIDICILRQCKHAIAELKECYEPKQPEQRWIPCSERLPEHSGIYLVTLTVAVEKYVVVRWYSQRGGWISDEHPEAWMPLPDPYREDDK